MLHAERIGHGYKVLENTAIYAECRDKGIHFETCPHSSILTGGVHMKDILNHPILRFAEDNTNFSINSDDPTITMSMMSDEIEMVQSWGLSEAHLTRMVS